MLACSAPLEPVWVVVCWGLAGGSLAWVSGGVSCGTGLGIYGVGCDFAAGALWLRAALESHDACHAQRVG